MDTRAGTRVEIAKDALAQLESEKLMAARGTFVDSSVMLDKLDDGGGAQIQKAFADAKSCQVCAVGALFVAANLRYDALTYDEFYELAGEGGAKFFRYLSRWFTLAQLQLIEIAFEGTAYLRPGRGPTKAEAVAALAWYAAAEKLCPDSRSRMGPYSKTSSVTKESSSHESSDIRVRPNAQRRARRVRAKVGRGVHPRRRWEPRAPGPWVPAVGQRLR